MNGEFSFALFFTVKFVPTSINWTSECSQIQLTVHSDNLYFSAVFPSNSPILRRQSVPSLLQNSSKFGFPSLPFPSPFLSPIIYLFQSPLYRWICVISAPFSSAFALFEGAHLSLLLDFRLFEFFNFWPFIFIRYCRWRITWNKAEKTRFSSTRLTTSLRIQFRILRNEYRRFLESPI